MYLSMKSRIVSQRAAKVGRDSKGERCWRKTWSTNKTEVNKDSPNKTAEVYICICAPLNMQ